MQTRRENSGIVQRLEIGKMYDFTSKHGLSGKKSMKGMYVGEINKPAGTAYSHFLLIRGEGIGFCNSVGLFKFGYYKHNGSTLIIKGRYSRFLELKGNEVEFYNQVLKKREL